MQHRTANFRTLDGWVRPIPKELDSPQTLVLAFCGPELFDQPELLSELAAAMPQSVLLGCSTSGEISGDAVSDCSISVAVARFEHTTLKRASTTLAGAGDSYAAGKRLAEQLAGDDLSATFLLSDGLCVNGTPLVNGLRENLPQGVSITGGLAGDGSRFARTWVLDGAKPKVDAVVAVGLYGSRVRVGHGSIGGWSDFGPERLITRSEGNVLYELDGKPALDLYKTYLGDLANELPGSALLFPLAVRSAEGGTKALVRTILAVDEANRTMTFAGDIPQGDVARLMRARTDQLIDSAGQAAREACEDAAVSGSALVISVSCVGRRLVLGERAEEEVESVLDSLPGGCSHAGFYAYGEISPRAREGVSELHNQTMTVTVFDEI